MQQQMDVGKPTAMDFDAQSREVVARVIAERARSRTVRKPLPGWARIAMRIMPWVLISVTLINLAIGLLAVVAPLLRNAFGTGATDWIYSAYSLICPQRPSHTTFVAGEPMAMEQRMVAMYLAFGIAGLLYVRWTPLRRRLPNWLVLVGVAPAVIDVSLSTAGIRPSTTDSRLWTGALASVAIVWWAYPRFEAKLRVTRSRILPNGQQ